tara:strand:- start:4096 stop:4398 length:303 start_codon:yes stop_codon:yes gene_type:complete
MSLCPFNRYISIVPDYAWETAEEAGAGILLPSDYSRQEATYCAATVLDWAPDCRLELSDDSCILVNKSMIEEVEYEGEQHYLILDNYVIAEVLDDSGEGE